VAEVVIMNELEKDLEGIECEIIKVIIPVFEVYYENPQS
jgi:hypothetical protein